MNIRYKYFVKRILKFKIVKENILFYLKIEIFVRDVVFVCMVIIFDI